MLNKLFTSKPNAILFVEHDSMSVQSGGHDVGALRLPEDLFRYLEVLNKQKFGELVVEYAKKSALSGKRVVIVLHKDVVFQKAVTLDGTKGIKSIVADFERAMPFVAEDRRAIGLKQKDKLYLFGANKSFYQLLVTALEASNVKVQAVVPGVVYGLTMQSKLTQSKLTQICNATALTSAANFLK